MIKLKKIVFVFANIFILSSIVNYTATAQMKTNKKSDNLYPFENYYIDLDTFKKIENKEEIASNFKTDSKFFQRFEAPIWFKDYPTQVTFKTSIFSTDEKGFLKLTDSKSSYSIILENKEENIPLSNTTGNNFLLKVSTGIIHIKKLDNTHGYYIGKYDEKGKVAFKTNIEHTKILKEENTHTHRPYLSFFTYTDDCLIFTSYNNTYPCTQLVNLVNGDLTTLSTSINGIIRSEDEKSVTGLVPIIDNSSFQKIDIHSQKPIWGKKADYYLSDRSMVETIEKDTILLLCFYNPIATGSSLYAHHKETGALLWKADVKQLNIGHSRYSNSITLSLYKDIVIMEGIEAGGNYLQLFNINTGERIFSSF